MVEFVLVGSLLLFLFLGLVQVGLVLHMRNVLTANAAEGARYEASLGVPVGAGARRAAELNRAALSERVAAAVPCRDGAASSADGVPLVEVRCAGSLPLTFLPLGTLHITVAGHAVREQPPP